MYKTISCKYATIALACHLHSYNKKNKEHNQNFFMEPFFFKLYKIKDSKLFITDQVSLVSFRLHAHWRDWSWTVAVIIQ